MRTMTLTAAAATILIISARGQGFQNLNFESAYDLTNNSLIVVTDALPGWSAYDGTEPLSEVYYVSNNFTGVATLVELEGGTLALSGDFSVGLYSGSISQTGMVPADAESLEFEAGISGNLSVTLGGQGLSYSALYGNSQYTVYGANIPSGLDGKTEALTFETEGVGASALLDNIEFSTSPIPEPSECALIGLGTILFGLPPSLKLWRTGWWRRKWEL